MSAPSPASATAHEARADTRPDLVELLKATAETMAAVKAATARLEGELTALRSQPRRKAAAAGA